MRATMVVCVGLLGCLPACAPEDIFVATTTIPDASDHGMSDGAAEAGADGASTQSDCASNADCDPRQYCAKSRCESAQGVCMSRPTLCDPAPRPVCGCDGVNYFNDCLRRASGIAGARDGECGASATPCGRLEDDPCPSDGYCGKLLPSGPYCPVDAPGTCWVLPAECGQDGMGGDRFVPCDDGFGGGGFGECVDPCRAIRSERPYARAQRCPH